MARNRIGPRRLVALSICCGLFCLGALVCHAESRPAPAGRTAGAQAGPSRIEHWPIPARDLEGNVHALGDSATISAWTLLFLSPRCERSAAYLAHLERLAGAFQDARIEFFAVVSDPEVTRLETLAWRDRNKLRLPVLFDGGQVLARALAATHTPQAVVIDSTGMRQYSGKIDDRPDSAGNRAARPKHGYLGMALRAVASGRTVMIRGTEPAGRPIDSRSSAERRRQVTWARQIAPLLSTHCSDCHHAGGMAPFPLTTFDEARRHGRALVEATEARRMPPWKPVRGFAELRHSRRLSATEVELVADWVNAGSPEGSADDLPPSPDYGTGWVLGEPDLELSAADGVDVPADGPAVTRCFVLPTDLGTDRLVAAIEFRPGAAAAIAQASVLLDVTRGARQLDAADPGPGFLLGVGSVFQAAGSLGGWAPMATAGRLPPGVGRLLPRGADIVLQIQYQPMGEAVRDESRLGVYLAAATAERRVGDIVVANTALKIPAGASRHRHRARYELPVATTILGLTPHLRELGREVIVTAVVPDGSTERLLRIDDWDPRWHDHYMLRRPLRLPAGTRIEIEAIFDNSTRNPRIDGRSPQLVRWGDVPGGEVAVCYVQVATDDSATFTQLLEHNRAALVSQPDPPGTLRSTASFDK